MADYYEKERALCVVANELKAYGWTIQGWNEDQSDSMTDYYHPESWDGVACFGAFTLCVDVSSYTAKGFGVNPTPKGSAWHIEKEGVIVAKGTGVFIFSSLYYNSSRNVSEDREYWNGKEQRPVSELYAKLDALMAKLNAFVGLTATKEEIAHEVAKAEALKRAQEDARQEAERIAWHEKREAFLGRYTLALEALPVLGLNDFIRSHTVRKENDLFSVIEDPCEVCEEVGKIEEIIDLAPSEFEHFLANLMKDHDFLKGKGGTGCDDARFDGLDYYEDIATNKELHDLYRQKCYECKIMVRQEGTNYYVVVNPHGYGYARYTDIPRSIENLGQNYR